MNWVDTHCHLQLDGRDPGELLKRAGTVDWVVVPGVDAASSEAAIELARRYPGRVSATAGLHPHEAERWTSERESVTAMAGDAVAIGETGLDFYRNLSSREEQEASFRAQIELACELDKPVIIHCRDAFGEVYDILVSTGAGSRSILHSWSGGRRWTKRFLDLGVMFSFSGIVAFDTADTVRLGAELVPHDRALVETDSPYLTPPPHRGEPNEPAWVSLVGEALAGVWNMPVSEVARITSANAARVFR